MMTAMTKDEIDAILDRVRMWPRPRQEDAALVLLAMEAQESSVYRLSDGERADIEKSLEELARGAVATEEEVTAVFDRYRR
jgi:predicted transcriptional regulator